MLHVRVPLRHQSPSEGRQDPLHRGQPRPSGQPRRALRQRRGRDHAALRPGAPDQAAQAGRRARRRRLCRDRVGRGARPRHRVAAAHPRERSEKARVLHRARSEPGADRLVGEPVRHPNYAAHGGFCSVNMAAGGFYTIGGSFWEFGEPDWERTRYFMLFGCAEDHASNPLKIALGELKAQGRQVRLGQSGAHRLLGDRRRVARHPPGHRRADRARSGARAAARRQGRSRLPDPLYQRGLAGAPGSGQRPTTACSRATRPAGRWSGTACTKRRARRPIRMSARR